MIKQVSANLPSDSRAAERKGACDRAPLEEDDDSPALASSQPVPADEYLSLT